MVRFMVLIMVLGSMLLAGPVAAHGPSDVEVTYDPETHILRVHAYHDSKNAAEHYVNKIAVKVNGKKMVEQVFRSQTDRLHQEALFLIIDAGVGDTIDVMAGCNIHGKKTVSMRISAPEPEAE